MLCDHYDNKIYERHNIMIPLSTINQMQQDLVEKAINSAEYERNVSNLIKKEINDKLIYQFGRLHLAAFQSAEAIHTEIMKYSLKLTQKTGNVIIVDVSDIDGAIFKEIYQNEANLYATPQNGFRSAPYKLLDTSNYGVISLNSFQATLERIDYFTNQSLDAMDRFDKQLSPNNPTDLNGYIVTKFIFSHINLFLRDHVSITLDQTFVKFSEEQIDKLTIEILNKQESAKLFNKEPDQATIILPKGAAS